MSRFRASTPSSHAMPHPRITVFPTGFLFPFLLAFSTFTFFEHRIAEAEDPTGVLTLQDAVELALGKHPELAVFTAKVRAGEARIVQAGKKPNPEASLELEDFAGSGALGGAKEMQSTLRLSSLIEFGGKRKHRREVAAASRDLAASEYARKRVDVLADVTESFITVVSAQEGLSLARETTATAQALQRIVTQRVEIGRASALEDKKASIATARATIDERRAERNLSAARTRLTATWGGTEPSYDQALANLFTLPSVPDFDTLLSGITDSPELALWTTETRLRQSEIKLARSNGTPNIMLGAGLRHFSRSDDMAFVAGASIPLPFFDRNQGGIAESRALLAMTEAGHRRAEVRLRAVLFALYQDLSNASIEAETTRQDLLPEASDALQFAEEGYREGRFSYLELADAQRTLLDLRRQLVAAATTFHLAVVEIERLTGQALNP